MSDWIVPDWPAPKNVRSLVTTRESSLGLQKGHSRTPYDSFNLALHVNDRAEDVVQNRSLLCKKLSLPESKFCWLNQVHGVEVVEAANALGKATDADGSFTSESGVACLVMTADCLPVLLCDQSGTRVAAVHAGWRGLADGVIEEAIKHFDKPENVMAWLGPAISQTHFEVGQEVLEAFISKNSEMKDAFIPSNNPGKYRADLYSLARVALSTLGVEQIYGGDLCTYADSKRFYSYRRDGVQSGRMASLIYLA